MAAPPEAGGFNQGGVKPSASIRENKSHAGFSPGVFIPLKTGTHPKFNQVGLLPSCTQTSAQMWRARPPAVVCACRQHNISADHSLFPALRFWIVFFFFLCLPLNTICLINLEVLIF